MRLRLPVSAHSLIHSFIHWTTWPAMGLHTTRSLAVSHAISAASPVSTSSCCIHGWLGRPRGRFHWGLLSGRWQVLALTAMQCHVGRSDFWKSSYVNKHRIAHWGKLNHCPCPSLQGGWKEEQGTEGRGKERTGEAPSFAEINFLFDLVKDNDDVGGVLAVVQIPFFPLVKKDLTFIHFGNDSRVDGLVNFEKLRMIAKEIHQVTAMSRSDAAARSSTTVSSVS